MIFRVQKNPSLRSHLAGVPRRGQEVTLFRTGPLPRANVSLHTLRFGAPPTPSLESSTGGIPEGYQSVRVDAPRLTYCFGK